MGVGPRFKVVLQLQNTGKAVVTGVRVTVTFDPEVFRIQRPSMSVPALTPGVTRELAMDVSCISPVGAAGDLRVAVAGPGDSCVPLLSATVTMPLSETEATLQ